MSTRLSPQRSQELHAFKDKFGRSFLIRACQDDKNDYRALDQMYERFEPKECAQGLPMRLEEQRQQWLQSLLREKLNLVALVQDRVVGHAVLLDMEPGKTCEYLVFVHQEHQNRGIGTALTRTVRQLAKNMGYCLIWLTVESTNVRAIHVYEKAGFCRVGPKDVECEMVMDLTTQNENT